MSVLFAALIGAFLTVAVEKSWNIRGNRHKKKRRELNMQLSIHLLVGYCMSNCNTCNKSEALQFIFNMSLDAVKRKEQPIRYKLKRAKHVLETPPPSAIESDVFPITYHAYLQSLSTFDVRPSNHVQKHVKKQWGKILEKPESLYL